MRTLSMLLVILVACFALSCSTVSVCDTINEGDSKLCDLARGYDVNLSLVGKGIQVANAFAIVRGYYTKAQVLEVATAMRGLHNGPLTYALLNTNLRLYSEQYPEIFKDIDLSVLDSLVLDTLLTPADNTILINFWDRVIRSMSTETA